MLTLSNDYHNTTVTLFDRNGKLTAGQIRRARHVLCGHADCGCGDEAGRRGHRTGEPRQIDYQYNARDGRLIGAVVPSMVRG